ncbi:hypothetical protein AGMMS49944_26030 [Spirochaetia bacterium]|nr:hypothetical protein AGMMS49944_26030 [Spirochaetia bacterium]
MNRTMSIDNKNRIALFCGTLALIFAIFSFAGCDSIEDLFHPDHDSGEEGGLNPVVSEAFTSDVDNNTLVIMLVGGTFESQANLALSQFTITTQGTPGFTSLTGGTVTRTSDTVVTITGLAPVTAAGSGQKITVDAAALATQAIAAVVVASGGGGLNPVESAAFDSFIGNDALTITLSGGSGRFGPQASLDLSQFAITSGTPGFASLTGGTVVRTSNTEVTITGLTAVTAPGSQKITVAAAALATQPTEVTVVASGGGGGGLDSVLSRAFTSVVGNDTLTITLTDGAYAAAPNLSHFTITTPGTNGFTSLTGGTVIRTSSMEVTITGLTAVTAAGSGQTITIAAAALATQAAGAVVVASGVPGLTSVESGAFTSVIGDHTLTITLTGGAYSAAPIPSQFTITTPGIPGFTSLTGGNVLRISNVQVGITGLTAVTALGSGQKITIAAAALETQATVVTVVASGGHGGGLNSVESEAFTSVNGDDRLTITLTGGVYAAAPIAPNLSHFTITTPGTNGFTSLTGGIVTRTSDTEVIITGLGPVTAAGSGQKITVDAAALATQAAAVTVQSTAPAPTDPDIYVAGYENSATTGGNPIAKVWKNGSVLYSLTDGTKSAHAKSVYVSGGDVYVAGYENSAPPGNTPPAKSIAKVWKNGSVLYSLTDGTNNAQAKSVYVSGGVVYTAGYESNGTKNVVKVWKNGGTLNGGSQDSLTDGTKSADTASVYVSGSDVYVAGNEYNGLSGSASKSIAKVWKNGVATSLTNGTYEAIANSVYVSGSNVYVAGYEEIAGYIRKAKVWQNGTELYSLTDGTYAAQAASIYVSGGDVYAAGHAKYASSGGKFIATVWKNGAELYRLPVIGKDTFVRSVFVLNGVVYTTGYDLTSDYRDRVTMWKDNVLTYLTDDTRLAEAYSIYVE